MKLTVYIYSWFTVTLKFKLKVYEVKGFRCYMVQQQCEAFLGDVVNEEAYISLTDIAKYKNPDNAFTFNRKYR